MPKEFSPAPEVQAIAEKLIEIFKPELEGFEIKYIFASENPRKDGRECIGLARKVTGLNAYLAGFSEGFFVLETGEPAYRGLDENSRIAFILHELNHFGITDVGNLALIPHDIEEFSQVVEVFGAYREDLILFSHALSRGEKDTSTRDEIIAQIING